MTRWELLSTHGADALHMNVYVYMLWASTLSCVNVQKFGSTQCLASLLSETDLRHVHSMWKGMTASWLSMHPCLLPCETSYRRGFDMQLMYIRVQQLRSHSAVSWDTDTVFDITLSSFMQVTHTFDVCADGKPAGFRLQCKTVLATVRSQRTVGHVDVHIQKCEAHLGPCSGHFRWPTCDFVDPPVPVSPTATAEQFAEIYC